MHSIRIDRINKLVEQRISGSPTLEEVEESGAAMRQAVRSLGTEPEVHRSLYDCSEMGPVDQAVVASAFRQLNDPRFTCVRAKKVAFVAPSALTRLQVAEPSRSRPNLKVFTNRADAMRWLFA